MLVNFFILVLIEAIGVGIVVDAVALAKRCNGASGTKGVVIAPDPSEIEEEARTRSRLRHQTVLLGEELRAKTSSGANLRFSMPVILLL